MYSREPVEYGREADWRELLLHRNEEDKAIRQVAQMHEDEDRQDALRHKLEDRKDADQAKKCILLEMRFGTVCISLGMSSYPVLHFKRGIEL